MIRFQILARTGTGGGPEGSPFFIQEVATYNNGIFLKLDISYTIFFIKFLKTFESDVTPKVNDEHKKANIEAEKANDGSVKANIREQLEKTISGLSDKTVDHILRIYEAYGTEDMFGRKDIMLLTGLKATRASEVIKLLTSAEIIEAVKGHGKGKYCFIKKLSEKPDYEGSV